MFSKKLHTHQQVDQYASAKSKGIVVLVLPQKELFI